MNIPEFAIVDIETTGGNAEASNITEIAIIIFDGQRIIQEYKTLIKPEQQIPLHIQALTGITNEMVNDAPKFSDIASQVHQLLQGRIFVAHNVHFDYSFILEGLKRAGFDWKSQRLCTVRLSKKFFKNLPSYSLGKLCHFLGINITDRHRAYGDAKATLILLKRMMEHDIELFNQSVALAKTKEQRLPTNIPSILIEKIPNSTGVYLFKNSSDKVIYVGKAKDLKKRVIAHLTGNKVDQRRQNFINEICDISYFETGTELMALLMECNFIKKLWPIYNSALKKFEPKYGLISFEDQKGYIRLAVCQLKKNIRPIYYFNSVLESTQFLMQFIQNNSLDFRLCSFLITNKRPKESKIQNEDLNFPDVNYYNQHVQAAIDSIHIHKRSFVIVEKGRNSDEKSFIYYKDNQVYALGFIDNDNSASKIDDIVQQDQLVINNFYMNRLVENYAKLNPDKIQHLTAFQLEET